MALLEDVVWNRRPKMRKIKKVVKQKYYFVFRDAFTGQFCTKKHAEKHPRTTVRHRVFYAA